MANYGESILSRVLDEGNILSLTEFDVKKDDFSTGTEKDTYEFIMDYAKSNGGKTPDYRTVIEHNVDFYYREGVTDDYRYMVRELKDFAAKRKLVELVMGTKDKTVVPLQDRINAMSGKAVIGELIEELRGITEDTTLRERVGTDLKRDGAAYLQEYRDRRDGKSLRKWMSKFQTINEEIGGYFSGNMYAWFGRSGRGKSVFVMEEAIEAAYQGANVLIWAMEMSRFEVMARFYASMSARQGEMRATIDGVDMEVGFPNRDMLGGSLSEEMEEALESFLSRLNLMMPGNITIRAADDEDFYSRSLRDLESDIIRTKADVVVIDPFYYLDYETNTSRTTGGDAANTSVKLRALAGRTRTCIHAITQADEDGQKSDETRELDAPARKDVLKTKALLQDSANLFAIDTLDGRGIIQLGKGRQGGEGATIEVVYLPNFGVVKEIGDELAAMAAMLGY